MRPFRVKSTCGLRWNIANRTCASTWRASTLRVDQWSEARGCAHERSLSSDTGRLGYRRPVVRLQRMGRSRVEVPRCMAWSICCLTLELAQQRHEIKCTKRADRCFATPLGTETLYAGISVRLNHRLKLWVSNAFREIFQVHIHISSAGNEQLLVPLSCHQRRIMTTADRRLKRQVRPCQYSVSRICADTFW
jgi:hypothetical protein